MKLLELGPEHLDDATYIASNMREWDRREIFATRWDGDPAQLAAETVQVPGIKWIFGLERPIGLIGAVPMWPGVWSVWCFGTDDFKRVGLSLTKFVRRVILPTLIEGRKCHRMQCHSIEGHTDAQAWLELFGGRKESRLEGFGRNGEDFWLYAWRRGDVLEQR